jgi:hypothetical protein
MNEARVVRQSSKAIKGVIAGHQDWVAKNAAEHLARATSISHRYLLEDESTALKVLPSSLKQFALIYGTRGLVQFLKYGEADWPDIDRSIAYQYWAVRLSASRFFKQAFLVASPGALSLEHDLSITACLLAYSLLHNLDQWENYLNDTLLAMVTSKGALTEGCWEKRTFEPFVLLLRQKLRGGTLPFQITEQNLGPYANVLAHWDDGLLTARDVLTICDYHCRNMQDRGRTTGEEFEEPPFVLYPVEILAIYKVREQLGLATPPVDHPLLATPLGSLAHRQVTVDSDDLICRVEPLDSEYFGQ